MAVPLLGFGLKDIEKVLTSNIAERKNLEEIQAMMIRVDQVLRSMREVDTATSRLAAAKTQLDEHINRA
jgi:hypothetical protein